MKTEARKIDKKSPDRKAVAELYKRTFPRRERFPVWTLRLMTALRTAEATAYYRDDKFCGFSYVIEQDKVVLLLYLAVTESMRGAGVGTDILKQIKQKYAGKTIILDAEEPNESAQNAAERRRRIEFYGRNGIYETDLFYKIRGVRYELLSTDTEFTMKDYERFWLNIYKIKRVKK